jgi:Predicted transcriptional regulator containing an HTH domain and an uncharacterized domain shared with the mammalian protein Schlafen
VIHRDYSLSGKVIKIAIFDDKVEITCPGKLTLTMDFNEMDSGQSDIQIKFWHRFLNAWELLNNGVMDLG